jgi:hypothetical protein
MVFNAADPTVVDSLTILINADLGGYNNPLSLHNPDNIDTSANSLMIQEDPGTPNVTATLTFKREGGQLILLTVPGS